MRVAIDGDRRRRVKVALEKANLDAVICAAPTNVLLLSGYWPVLGTSVVVFDRDGLVTVVLPEDELEIAQSTSDARMVTYKLGSLHSITSPLEAIHTPLLENIDTHALRSSTMAIELAPQMQPSSYSSSLRFNAGIADLLASMLPKARTSDCAPLLEPLQAIKTTVEIDLIRRSAAMAATAFKAIPNIIEPGVRECDVAARTHAAFEAAPQLEGVQRWSSFFFCMSGPNSAKASGAFAMTSTRRIEQGDLVLVHANTSMDGYWTDITRTFTVGDASERQQEMRDAIGQARRAAFMTIHPGVPASAVDAAARNVMIQHGMADAFRHSTGHGVGFAAANPHALPRIHPKSPDILVEGMTFNVEPAAYFEGYGGMRHCDMVAVAGTGMELLTEFE